MRHIDSDRLQDVISGLEDIQREDRRVLSPENAGAALTIFEVYESRENTVLGMLMARRPHEEIRDALLARPSDGSS